MDVPKFRRIALEILDERLTKEQAIEALETIFTILACVRNLGRIPDTVVDDVFLRTEDFNPQANEIWDNVEDIFKEINDKINSLN